ncbi:MAG TPA: hypothetical protein VF026_30155 [Ktedonobacteraceae bacterium]
MLNEEQLQQVASLHGRPLQASGPVDATSPPLIPSQVRDPHVPFLGLGPARVNSLCRGSAEGEHKRLHACIEKLDLELAISNVPRLPDQLIQPLVGHRAVALLVNVTAVSCAWGLSIEEHAKAHGRSSRCRPHDQMQIAGVKAVRDAPVGLVQRCGVSPHRPLTRKGPMIVPQPRGDSIKVTLVQHYTTGRREVLGARVPDIGFRRPETPPIGGSFRTLCIDRDRFMSEATDARLGQQVLQNPFR